MPIKAGHGPSHSTDFNWPRLLPPTGPSQSGVSYIERRSVSNPGSHYRESSALPTELQGRARLESILFSLPVRVQRYHFYLCQLSEISKNKQQVQSYKDFPNFIKIFQKISVSEILGVKKNSKLWNFEISILYSVSFCIYFGLFVRFALKLYFWGISEHWADFGQNWREVTPQKRQFPKKLPDFDQI